MFPEYGIPFNITKGLPLSSSPLTTLFILLIDIPLNGYERSEISKFFASSLVSPIMVRGGKEEKAQWLRFLQKEGAFFAGGEEVNIESFVKSQSEHKEGCQFGIEAIDKVARQCGIQAGDIVTSWLPRARDYFFSLYRSSSDQGRGTEILNEYYLFLHQLFYLKQNVKPFGDLLSQQYPHKIVQNLFYLLDIFGIQKNILSLLKDEIGLHRQVAERIIKRDVRTLYTLRDLAIKAAKELEKVELYTAARSRAPLLERFRRHFIDLVNRSRIKEYYQRGAVGISEWDDIIGCSCDYIFAGGLTADEFPLKEPYDFIVPDSSERYLRKIDLADQSRYLFSSSLCNYRQCLYLSYPKRIQDKEVQPSPVLLDMVSIIDDHSQSPSLGIDILESSFPWNENPYFTSSEEFLNSLEVEKKLLIPSKEGQFTNEHIILGTDTALNESIVRGLHCLIARNSIEGLSEYDGLVFNSRNFPHILSLFKDTFSTSRLDMLANCPLRYLFLEIFCLEPVEELEEELSVKDIGSHVHAILKILFDELKKHGENVSSIGLSRSFALAREIGNQYFAQLTHLEGLYFFETQKREIMDGLDTESLMSENGLPKREGLLAQLLRFEAQNLHGQDVIALEWGFGYEATNPVYIGRTPIRGYIDRVDRLAGEDDVFLIYDYKTGRAPALNEIKKGLSFQMPGYIWAIIGGRQSKAITARYYLINRRSLSESNPFTSPICYHHGQKTGIDLSGVTLIGDYVDKLMGLLKRGVFHHSTDELMCSYCEFKYACYKNTRRMAYLVDSRAFPEVYSGRKNLEKWKEVEALQKRWKDVKRKIDEPLEAKKEEKRREDLEQVLELKRWLMDKRHSLPFDEDYIDGMLASLEDYQHSSKY
jgi:RecB family exonuclease